MFVFRFSIIVLVFAATHATPTPGQSPDVSITFLERLNIRDRAEGLTEPSGLVISKGRRALWTVSDDTEMIFKIGIDGELKRNDYFEVELKGLEGITLDEDGSHLYVVKENKNSIIRIDVDDEESDSTMPLKEMAGFADIEDLFDDDEDNNKGLEGITMTPDGGLWVIKEGQPGLLLKVSTGFDRIESTTLLSPEAGFVDDDIRPKKIDFSGICYDAHRERLWIVSDKAQRLYLFDPATEKVTQSFALGYNRRGHYREIEKAEGVTIDAETDRMYIISDEEAKLYIYQIK